MKVVTIVGARPQFIKAAPVGKALRDAGHTEFILHTGQHYDWEMDGIFFEELHLHKPAFHLDCQKFGDMYNKLKITFEREKPDMVQVFGDTNSSLAGALAAAHLSIKVVHVEAGLRSGKPMIEEVNRKVILRIGNNVNTAFQKSCKFQFKMSISNYFVKYTFIRNYIFPIFRNKGSGTTYFYVIPNFCFSSI